MGRHRAGVRRSQGGAGAQTRRARCLDERAGRRRAGRHRGGIGLVRRRAGERTVGLQAGSAVRQYIAAQTKKCVESGVLARTYRLECDVRDGRRRQHAIRPVDSEFLRALLDLLERLVLLRALVAGAVEAGAARGIARGLLAGALVGEVLLCDLLVVLVYYLRWDAFHAEDLDVEAAAAGDCVFDLVELLLVDLGHVHVETW